MHINDYIQIGYDTVKWILCSSFRFFKDGKYAASEQNRRYGKLDVNFIRKAQITILNSFLQIFRYERIISLKIREMEKKDKYSNKKMSHRDFLEIVLKFFWITIPHNDCNKTIEEILYEL